MAMSRMRAGTVPNHMIDAQEQLNCCERGNSALKIAENDAICDLIRDVARRESRPV